MQVGLYIGECIGCIRACINRLPISRIAVIRFPVDETVVIVKRDAERDVIPGTGGLISERRYDLVFRLDKDAFDIACLHAIGVRHNSAVEAGILHRDGVKHEIRAGLRR